MMHFSVVAGSIPKFRNEIKYLASEGMLRIAETRITGLCTPDPHGGTDGHYVIRSLYFDDPLDSCLTDNETGTDPRFKYRIRMYNGDKSYIALEQKCKRHGMNYKRSCRLDEQFCTQLLAGRFDITAIPSSYRPAGSDASALLEEFQADYHMNLFRPKVIVEYHRSAYLYPTGNVRITMDRCISASGNTADFLTAAPALFPVMPSGLHILEVKYDDLLPDYLYHALERIGCIHTAFSKYDYSRQFCG